MASFDSLAAWRIADVPWWVGVICLAIAAGLFVGWLRRDANGDGIPDRFQKPNPLPPAQ
jgi:hypothetical protein